MSSSVRLHRCRVAVAAVALAAVVLSACGDPASRDRNDATAPVLTMSIAGTKANPGGIDDVAFGTTTELSPSGAQVLIKAADDDGVSVVELWMTEKKQCPGVVVGPGLAGAPAAKVVGNVTPTEAPSSLVAIFRVDATNRQVGCTYSFEVWGEADNAADTPVHAKSPTATVTLKT